MKLAEIKVNDYGGAPIATHNMPCAVCRREHAVLNLSRGSFSPCWTCQREGWQTVNLYELPFLARLLLWRVFGVGRPLTRYQRELPVELSQQERQLTHKDGKE